MEHENLTAALAGFHADAPTVVKDATAKVKGESKNGAPVTYTYGYADLATVTEALNPLLGKHGLAFTSKPTMTPAGFGLVYALKHESGETDEGFWPLPDPTRMKPQDLGSWITYWRRYAFLAVTNTFPSGEDDDGQQASASPRTAAVQDFDNLPKERPQQAPAPATAGPKTYNDKDVAGQHDKLKALDLGKAGQLYDWMAKANLHEKTIDGRTATEVLAGRMGDIAMLPSATAESIAALRDMADGRGLLKVQVSESETLDQVLYEARELIQAEAEAAGLVDPAVDK